MQYWLPGVPAALLAELQVLHSAKAVIAEAVAQMQQSCYGHSIC